MPAPPRQAIGVGTLRKNADFLRCTVVYPAALLSKMAMCQSGTSITTGATMSRNPYPPKPMTPAAAARIQGSAAKANGGTVAKGSFAARAQRAAATGPRK